MARKRLDGEEQEADGEGYRGRGRPRKIVERGEEIDLDVEDYDFDKAEDRKSLKNKLLQSALQQCKTGTAEAKTKIECINATIKLLEGYKTDKLVELEKNEEALRRNLENLERRAKELSDENRELKLKLKGTGIE